MRTADSFIPIYDIKEVQADAGMQRQDDEIYVYTTEDLPIREKMFRLARSDHYSMHLNLGETLEIQYNLINYSVPKNALFIVHPDIVHVVKQADNLQTITLGFTRDFLTAAMLHRKHAEALGFLSQRSVPLFLLTEGEAQTLYPQLVHLKNLIINGHPFKEDMIYHVYNLFMLEMAALSKKYRGAEEPGLSRQDDILVNFLKQLAAHFKEERSVQFYADALYITPKHLTKTVKELTTKTCGELIDEMVIVEAKLLLSDLSYSVGQVADHLHFSDQFFFSKFFKRRTGMSPKEYKNSL